MTSEKPENTENAGSAEPVEIDETLPEVVQRFLRSGATLESIRLDDRGNWTHEGLDFENPKIIDLFNRSVGRTEGGTWVLRIPPFTYPIEVDDTGYFVESVSLDDGPPRIALSDATEEELDLASLRYEPEGRLYCDVKGGLFRARFKRNAYYALTDRMVEGDDGVELEIAGQRIPVAGS